MNINLRRIIGTLITAFLGAFLALMGLYILKNNSVPFLNSREVYTNPQIVNTNIHSIFKATELDFTKAAEKSINAVVHVKTQYSNDSYSRSNDLFDFFFGEQDYEYSPEPIMASGSGVIISSDGYIITNNHVIDESNMIEVVLDDKRTYKAKLIGNDPTTDIALLKINDTNLPFLMYGDSDSLMIGEWVLAVGNPFNLTSTVTAGIVSAKARNINVLSSKFAIESFIQTDAAVNPGNSGGALVNKNGKLIGINTAIASQTGYFSGYSFAIPVSIAKKVVDDIMEFGFVQRAMLGVDILDVDSKVAQEYNINKIEGVYVAGLVDDGAAKLAGIKEADIITQIGDIVISNAAELQEQIGKRRPGDKINVTIKRNNEKLQIEIILRNHLGTTNIVRNPEIFNLLGATFKKLPKELKSKLKLNDGVQIVDINSGKLMKAGIRKNFIITYINRELITSIEDVMRIIEDAKGGIYIEGIYPNGETSYYAFGMK